jgi:pectate lyase-like protein
MGRRICLVVALSGLLVLPLSATSEQGPDVRKLGATGNGVTDDTAAIVRAIGAASPGDAIVFPNGTYLVAGLTITKPITLMGSGGATLKANSPTPGTTLLRVGVGADGTVVTGLRFAGNDLMRGIDVNAAQRVVIRENRFDNRFSRQTIRLQSAHFSRIHDNFFGWEGPQGPDGGVDANAIVSLWQSDRVVVHDNTLVGLAPISASTRAQRGIFSQLGNGVSIVGNILKHQVSAAQQTGTPIAIWAAIGAPKYGAIIANNHIDGGYGNQIYVKNRMHGVTISGNVVTNANGAGGSAALVSADQSDYCVITGNTVYNSSNGGDGINIRAENGIAPSYCVVEANTIQGAARNGISVDGRAHRIANNVARNNAANQMIVQARGSDIQVYENYFEGGAARITDLGKRTAFRNNGGLSPDSSMPVNPLVSRAATNLSPTSTTGTTTQTLASYTLPAKSLSAPSKGLRVTAWATTASNTNLKSFGLDFGTITCAAQSAAINGGSMRLEVTLFRTGADTHECAGLSTASTGVFNQVYATAPGRDGAPIAISVWGQTPSAAQDLTLRFLWVEFIN